MVNAESAGEYYVYGLVDPARRRTTTDDLLSVFYVGKGKNDRSGDHARDVPRKLNQMVEVTELLGSKEETIMRILERGEDVPALKFASGIANEDDAYIVEQAVMTLMAELLRRSGQPPLGNTTPGHHQGIVQTEATLAAERTEADAVPALNLQVTEVQVDPGELDIDQLSEAQRRELSSVLLVKGTRAALDVPVHQKVPESRLPPALRRHAASITPIEFGQGVDYTRPGWDPDDPWDANQAAERGQQYWSLGRDRVLSWFDGDTTRPTQLWLAIPTARGKSVVRYIWQIDYSKPWHYFVETDQWGLKLGKQILKEGRKSGVVVHDHALYETRPNGRVQVLQNYAAGWRHLIF